MMTSPDTNPLDPSAPLDPLPGHVSRGRLERVLRRGEFAVTAELNPPDNTRGSDFFGALDVAFTYIFTVELVVNLLANWFWAFFLNGWSVFDLIVVCISLTSLVLGDMPGVNTLRLMRAFRVMRLFGRLQVS